MKRIRVLVVDDSVVIRRMLREALSEDPLIEVVGVAANGKIGLSMVEQLSPDLVTLDIEMPEMDGLDVLRQLRVRQPALPVVMFSTLTQRGAVATLDALALGARDYVAKPANVDGITAGLQRIREDLTPKIKALCGYKEAIVADLLEKKSCTVGRSTVRSGPIEVVAIGCSTGGPNALAEVLPKLAEDLPVPVIIVQHMPPTFTRFLAERLNASCALEVREAEADQVLEAGEIWIAPGDFHVAVQANGTKVHLRTNQSPRENSCRPSVDVLFRTVARVYGNRALAVILTGMGQDGLRGTEELKSAGAFVVAQDEESSVVWGMPGFVVQAGLADRVVPLANVAQEITKRVAAGRQAFTHRLGA
ncbi:MAG TPA: chemotaxis response regulator protein-glutamate methylesterase [Terriglobales bacterium]|nr:chemotaxis response regulator protein-glutamate methylesterase [Terriglobales bacterium]